VLAVVAAIGFSFKAILVKLAYAVPSPVELSALTLLALRMLYSLPVFAWIAWRESRARPPLTGRQWLIVTLLGMLGYYGASLFDFIGLQYISVPGLSASCSPSIPHSHCFSAPPSSAKS
jgi:drug/metabolite transporter (DMT)-like permease